MLPVSSTKQSAIQRNGGKAKVEMQIAKGKSEEQYAGGLPLLPFDF
jgi:hypothetical protein